MTQRVSNSGVETGVVSVRLRMRKVGRRRAWKVRGKESVVQSEIELARSWEGFSRPLSEVCAFAGIYPPSFSSTLLQCWTEPG